MSSTVHCDGPYLQGDYSCIYDTDLQVDESYFYDPVEFLWDYPDPGGEYPENFILLLFLRICLIICLILSNED